MMDAALHKSIRTAIKRGCLNEVVDILCKNPEALRAPTPFGTWLHVAASFGQLAIVKKLIEMGLDINACGGIAEGTPLHRAAADGHYDVVKYLIDAGAKLDVSEPERNPLFGAIINGHVEIGRLLIERGIDVRVRYSGSSMKEMDALAFAIERGATSFVELLGKHLKRVSKE